MPFLIQRGVNIPIIMILSLLLIGRRRSFSNVISCSRDSRTSSMTTSLASTFNLFVTAAAFTPNPRRAHQLRNNRPFASSKLFDKKPPSNRKKFKVTEKITQENTDKLAAAFDELARKEGFDSSTSFYAPDQTFEDEFNEEDYFLDEDDDDDDEFLDFGSDENDDMDARIAAAKQDLDSGKVSIPRELDEFAGSISPTKLEDLGFRPESNPYGNDETPRREGFRLITNPMVCSACGSDFQCTNEAKPGFIPPEKFDVQIKLGKIEELQKLKDKQDSEEWTPEDEIEWLIQTSGGSGSDGRSNEITDDDMKALADELEVDLGLLARKKTICKRCHGLQNFGKVDNALRPGYTKEPMLSQAKFRDLLRPIREKPAVIIALIDLFDFAGSVLPELDDIAGENPVILAANKADLLPEKMGKLRAEKWVRKELQYMGVKSLANIGGAVQLISCKTGQGVDFMLSKARSLAEEIDGDIYVVGAANAGKSTLLNRILDPPVRDEAPKKRRAGNANARKGAVTTSPLPGTTLKFIKVDLGNGRSLFDTPGLLIRGSLTHLLTPEELKMVVPTK